MKVVFIDFYDSFTYNVVNLLKTLGADVKIFQAYVPQGLEADCFVLGPGPGRPSHYPEIQDWLKKNLDLPILGICLGHQFLGELFGAKVVHAKKPMHGKMDQISHSQEGVFQGLPSPLSIVRYHSLVLDSLPDALVIDALSSHNEVMAISHKVYPMIGLQFHPESCAGQLGKEIIGNVLKRYMVKCLTQSFKSS